MDLPTIKPRIIIHGGAGNITRENLPAAAEAQYRSSLLQVLESATNLLNQPHSTALEVATHVSTSKTRQREQCSSCIRV